MSLLTRWQRWRAQRYLASICRHCCRGRWPAHYRFWSKYDQDWVWLSRTYTGYPEHRFTPRWPPEDQS